MGQQSHLLSPWSITPPSRETWTHLEQRSTLLTIPSPGLDFSLPLPMFLAFVGWAGKKSFPLEEKVVAKWNPILTELLPLSLYLGTWNFQNLGQGCTYQEGWRDPVEGGSQAPVTQLTHQAQSCHKDGTERKGKALQPQFSEDDSITTHCRHNGNGDQGQLCSPRGSPIVTFMGVYGDWGGGPHLLGVCLLTKELWQWIFKADSLR